MYIDDFGIIYIEIIAVTCLKKKMHNLTIVFHNLKEVTFVSAIKIYLIYVTLSMILDSYI